MDPPPPYTSATATVTCKSEATASSYEMEEEDIFDFKFNDDIQTQPYLSLGLTPLSQLSPPDHGPPSSKGDSYYFPSMLPPVTPISSVFNISGSTPSSTGIPVDSPFVISNGGMMVMPEANPVTTDALSNGVSRRPGSGRKNKHEINAHSQGYAMKLEPVPEQSCSLDDSFGSFLQNHNGIKSSSSSAEDSNNLLLYSNRLQPSQLSRKAGKRRKSGTRRKIEEEGSWDDNDFTFFRNKNTIQSSESPVKLSREENQKSPRQEGRKIRQQMRREELERQKEKLWHKKLEEEQARLVQQDQRAAKIVRDYGATRQNELNQTNAGLVLQEAMRYEAQVQIMQEESRSNVTKSPSRVQRGLTPNNVVSTSSQFSVL